jgi:divalent metal cation (Fe/Co/Zn/Cd) transporter
MSDFPAEAAAARERETRALRLAVILYLVVFTIKLAAYLITGVMALFAEAMHTVGDIFVSGFLLIALMWSRKEPDETHMFGYGRTQSAAALVAATLFISFTALRLYEEPSPACSAPRRRPTTMSASRSLFSASPWCSLRTP